MHENYKATGILPSTCIKRSSERKLKFPKDFEKYYKKVQNGDLTKKDLARIFGVSRQHVYDYIALYEKETKNA